MVQNVRRICSAVETCNGCYTECECGGKERLADRYPCNRFYTGAFMLMVSAMRFKKNGYFRNLFQRLFRAWMFICFSR